MNDLTAEWVQKAEGDFTVAEELLKLTLESTTDAICFHCQQCVEKYTKAYLQHHSIDFPRTHNLAQLLMLCLEHNEAFEKIELEMRMLNSYSVETRYPGRFTSLEEARGAVDAAEIVRNFVRSKLGL